MKNIIDLFSGGGGLTEGFRTNNFNIISHVEMDPAACQTLVLRDAFYYLKNNNKLEFYFQYITNKISFQELQKHLPKDIKDTTINATISEDTINSIFKRIEQLRKKNRIDGIIGGPPCQAYSTIGRARNKQKKESDERIYLYKYYIRFIEHYHPKFFIFENVKGLLSFKDSFGNALLPKIIEEFKQIFTDDPYIVTYKLINAADYGVPQLRQRLIIFGCRKSHLKTPFFDNLSNYTESAPTINNLFKDLPKMKSGQTINHYNDTKPDPYISKNIRIINEPLTQNIARPNNKNDLKIYSIVAKRKKNHFNTEYSKLPKPLIHHKNTHIFIDRFKALDADGYSQTITAHIAKDGHYFIHPDVLQNRSITVREAARIQTFPDNYYFESSRTAAYKQIGNAVPPHLAKKLSACILNTVK